MRTASRLPITTATVQSNLFHSNLRIDATFYSGQSGKRDKANIIYNTSLPVLFGVKKYADSLWKVVKDRDITVNPRRCLTEVRPDSREAVFVNLDKPEQQFVDKVGTHAQRQSQPPCYISIVEDIIPND